MMPLFEDITYLHPMLRRHRHAAVSYYQCPHDDFRLSVKNFIYVRYTAQDKRLSISRWAHIGRLIARVPRLVRPKAAADMLASFSSQHAGDGDDGAGAAHESASAMTGQTQPQKAAWYTVC